MNFKTIEKNDEALSDLFRNDDDTIFWQSQKTNETKENFKLSWMITFSNGESVISEWTPSILPSIKATLFNKKNPVRLTIRGLNTVGNFKIELARVPYKLIDSFGYIAQAGLVSETKIIGIWIKLNNKMIKVFTTGLVKEQLQ